MDESTRRETHEAGKGCDEDMRSSAKRPILEVEADSAPSWMPAMIAMINANLDTKLTGLERRMDQVVGIHQVRLDKHDAELDSQRQLLEELRSEIRLLRHFRLQQHQAGQRHFL